MHTYYFLSNFSSQTYFLSCLFLKLFNFRLFWRISAIYSGNLTRNMIWVGIISAVRSIPPQKFFKIMATRYKFRNNEDESGEKRCQEVASTSPLSSWLGHSRSWSWRSFKDLILRTSGRIKNNYNLVRSYSAI